MATLSLAMIVKNEEMTLKRVLECARQFCDELIVVDTGSTDRTVEIAQECGAVVRHFTWVNDFAKARNFAFAQATSDWVMWLDADDYMNDDDIENARALKTTHFNDEALQLVYCPYIFHVDKNGRPLQQVVRERFVRNNGTFLWHGAVHETIKMIEGAKSYTIQNVRVFHDPRKTKDPNRYIDMIAANLQPLDQIDPDQLKTFNDMKYYFYYASELHKMGQFEKAIEYFDFCLRTHVHFSQRYMMSLQAARCYISLKDLDTAQQYCHHALQIDSARGEAFALLGEIQFMQQHFLKAIPFFHAAINSTMPKNTHAQPLEYGNRSFHFLSCCYSHLGNRERAIEFLVKALKDGADTEKLIPQLKNVIDDYVKFSSPNPNLNPDKHLVMQNPLAENPSAEEMMEAEQS